MFKLRNSNEKSFLQYLAFAGVFTATLLMSELALAAGGGSPVGANTTTLGGVIINMVSSSSTIPGLLSGFSYLCGIILGFLGIWKLKEHVESPNQVQIWDPLKRFLAGGSFFALPVILEAAYNTVAKDQDVLTGKSFNTGGAAKGGGLDTKMVDLMADIWEPLQWLFVGFGYLAGIILVMIGISRLLKTEQEGARGPMGIGTIMTFIVAGVLLSLNKILGSTVNSIFQSPAMNHAELSYTDGMDAAAQGHANAVIGAAMAFVAIIGWISFIRGFFIMRGVAEGNQQASAMAGFTHIIGGAIAVNLGAFLNAVQNTLGITAYGLKLSSIEPYVTAVTFVV